jgi:hypothetical protein
MILGLVMILVGLFIVLIVAVLVGQRRPRRDRRRGAGGAHLPAGDEAANRRTAEGRRKSSASKLDFIHPTGGPGTPRQLWRAGR